MATIDKYILKLEVQGTKAVAELNDIVGRLDSTIAQVGFAAFIANSYRMADSMKDLAESVGMTSGYVYTLAQGLEAANGDFDSVNKVITTFYQNIEEMAAGSDAAERSLSKLNITFKDLQTLTSQQLLKKAIDELAKMDAGARRTALGIQVFGKAFAQVDPKKLQQILESGDPNRLTAELDKAAETVAVLEANYRTLQEVGVTVFNRLIFGTDSLRITSQQALTVIQTFINLMIGVKFIQAINVVSDLAQSFFRLARAIGAAKAAATLLAGSVVVLGVAAVATAAMYAWDKFNGAVDDARQNINDLNDTALNPEQAKQRADQINAAYAASIQGLQMSLQAGKITLAEFQREVEKADALRKQNLGGVQPGAAGEGAFPDASRFAQQEQEARARAAQSAKLQTEFLRQQFELQTRNKTILNEIVGLDEQQAELIREISGIALDYDQKRLDYQNRINEELAKGKDANMGVVAELRKQLKDLDSQQETTTVLKVTEIERKQNLEQISSELQKQLMLIDAALEKQRGEIDLLRAQRVISGILTEEEAAYLADRETIIAESDARIATLNEQLKNEINAIKRSELEEAIRVEQAKTDTALTQMERRREAEREMEQSTAAGTKKVFEDMRKSVTPYQVAVDSLQSAFRSVDNALTEFVTKGKFNFKDFTRSLLADIALIIARALVMRAILAIVGAINPAAGAALGTMMGVAPAGRASGGPVSGNRAYIVGEKGPEMFMPATAGTIVPNNQLAMAGGGTTQVTYNINAVDASSFRSLVARDPQFIYNVTEVGRRSSPSRRLA